MEGAEKIALSFPGSGSNDSSPLQNVQAASKIFALSREGRSIFKRNGSHECRIQNGHDLGRELEIIEMSGKRLGRLGVCTQPLFTERVWLRDWVDYQFQIGADEVLMHWAKVSSINLIQMPDPKPEQFHLNFHSLTPAAKSSAHRSIILILSRIFQSCPLLFANARL